MITSLDIEKKKFKNSLNGYNKKEVDNFLNEIASGIEKLAEENRVLKSRVEELAKVQEDYRSMEEDLKNTLATAQKLQSNIQDTAKMNAETLLKETEMKCSVMRQEAQKEADELNRTISLLKAKKLNIINSIKTMLKEQYTMVETLSAGENNEEN